MKLREVILGVMALACASCQVHPPPVVFEAEYSAAAVELMWKHREGGKFETLSLICDPGKVGADLPIDGDNVVATYLHGAPDNCPRFHRVTGTLHLLEHGATDIRARVDAVMQCPDTPSVPLKGEFTFETKVPR